MTELVKFETKGLMPKNMAELKERATLLAQSNMIPDAYRGKPNDILVAILYGFNIEIPPESALQYIYVIKGKPTIWGDLIPALIFRHHKGHKIEEWFEGEGESLTAHCVCTRGDREKVVKWSYSVQDAKKAGLFGKSGPWQQHLKRMLQLKARNFATRDCFADILLGIEMREAVEDMEMQKVNENFSMIEDDDDDGVEDIDLIEPEEITLDVQARILYTAINRCADDEAKDIEVTKNAALITRIREELPDVYEKLRLIFSESSQVFWESLATVPNEEQTVEETQELTNGDN